jgi:hypothetical protein
MTHDEKLAIAKAMIDHGGGFVSRLGDLWLRADADNCRRIEEAFPHYINQYRALALKVPQ